MAISKAMRRVLKALSFDGVEVDAARHLAKLKAIDPMKIFYKAIDYNVYNGTHRVPMRIFFPHEKSAENEPDEISFPVLLFFHGGGWVTDSVDNYERVCARMANATNHVVVAVEYRLAPEHRFPLGLMDCYEAAKALYTNQFLLNVKPEQITVIGDSAGGNLSAALCLMARDKGEFLPKRQILIYPAVNSDYSDTSPYPSVRENGTDYLLTQGRLLDYIALYKSQESDLLDPYFAPIKSSDLSNQPKTLILTAEFDPLRDEGEDYGKKLAEAGNMCRVHRIKDALHGFFALGIEYQHVRESYEQINAFLKES